MLSVYFSFAFVYNVQIFTTLRWMVTVSQERKRLLLPFRKRLFRSPSNSKRHS